MLQEIKKHVKRVKYLFTLEADFEISHPIFENVTFMGDFVMIAGGKLYIKAGYSWDGNTPQFKLFGLVRIGTPNGRINPETGKPKTYYASLVHDALYQYFPKHEISRKAIDDLYFEMLKQADFKGAGVYHKAVRALGGIYIALTR